MRWPWQKDENPPREIILLEALKAAEKEHDLLVLALSERIEKRVSSNTNRGK